MADVDDIPYDVVVDTCGNVSSNLLVWPTDFLVGATTASSSPGVSISENGPGADTITIAIPLGSDRIKSARLKVSIVP